MTASDCAFFDALRKSRLLTEEQLAGAKQILAHRGGASSISSELVRRRWLTRWQLQQIEAGHTRFQCADYTLVDVVGRGSMGIVYKALHRGNRALVALKVMSGRAAASDRRSARFQREIRLVRAVRSPYVVRALDSGCLGGRDFLVMELIPGRTLDCWIKANRRLPVRWACECARQVAIGLQHVHESGLIHRDIKPSNIMVAGDSFNRRPHVRILDLGLGRFTGRLGPGEDLTRDGHTVGTLDYMAPEQLQDTRLVDIRSDIYALGCTLFEALTGRQPFDGKDLGEKMLAKLTGEPDSLDKHREDAPTGLAELVRQMVHQEPERRPSNPREVADCLLKFSMPKRVKSRVPAKNLESRPVTSSPPPPTSRSKRFRWSAHGLGRTLRAGIVHCLARSGLIHGRRLRTSG